MFLWSVAASVALTRRSAPMSDRPTITINESPSLELLRAKLKAREGKAEYRENVKFLREEIVRLEKEQADG